MTQDDELKIFDNAYVLDLTEYAVQKNLKSNVLSPKSEVHHRVLAEENARASAQSESTLLATMSHELRIPLYVVIGAIQLLIVSGLESEKTKYANITIDRSKI